MGRKPNTGTILFFLDEHYQQNGHIYAINNKGAGWTYVNSTQHFNSMHWTVSNIVAQHCLEWLEQGYVTPISISELPLHAQSTVPYGT